MIVYPDYPINTDTWYGYTTLAGHAGVVLVKNSGATRYFEFGRYDKEMKGEVRSRPVPNIAFEKDGSMSLDSLRQIMSRLSKACGHNTRIRAAQFLNVNYDKMLQRATEKQAEYEISGFNCGRYAEAVILAGNPNIDSPNIIIPTPRNIVEEYIEEGNVEICFDPKSQTIVVGTGDESDAKND